MLVPETVRRLIDGPVEVVVTETEPEKPLRQAESQALGRAADVRRREFAAGRWCAHEALSALGQDFDALLRDDDRLPVWPEGLVGSISHTREVAVAVVGRTDHWCGLGVDIETRSGLERHLWDKILTPAERAALPPGREESAALALFCAKEALYKAWYPLRRVFLGFHDVELVRHGEEARLVSFKKGEPPPLIIRLDTSTPTTLATATWPKNSDTESE